MQTNIRHDDYTRWWREHPGGTGEGCPSRAILYGVFAARLAYGKRVIGRELIVSDNSPAQWAFAHAFAGRTYSIADIRIPSLGTRPFCVRDESCREDADEIPVCHTSWLVLCSPCRGVVSPLCCLSRP